MTNVIVKQSGIKVMICTDGTSLQDLLDVIDQAIKGAGYIPSGTLMYYDEAEEI